MLVYQGSLTDIIFIDAFNKLRMPVEEIGRFHSSFMGFAGEQVRMKGYIELLTTFVGVWTIPVKFLIIEREDLYNSILGKPSLNKLNAIVSTPT